MTKLINRPYNGALLEQQIARWNIARNFIANANAVDIEIVLKLVRHRKLEIKKSDEIKQS